MPKLTIPLLAISFFLVFGCASKPKISTSGEVVSVANPYFSDASKDYVYRTKITVYGHELNGVLIAKKISDSIHRVVLTTDFGNTLLDFEVGQTSFVKNSIVEDLDRKIIVNTLRDDFRLLFRERFAASEIHQENQHAYTNLGFDDKDGHYVLKLRNQRLVAIEKGSRSKVRVVLEFESANATVAQKISITHHDIKLHIGMHQFEQ